MGIGYLPPLHGSSPKFECLLHCYTCYNKPDCLVSPSWLIAAGLRLAMPFLSMMSSKCVQRKLASAVSAHPVLWHNLRAFNIFNAVCIRVTFSSELIYRVMFFFGRLEDIAWCKAQGRDLISTMLVKVGRRVLMDSGWIMADPPWQMQQELACNTYQHISYNIELVTLSIYCKICKTASQYMLHAVKTC